MKQNSHSEKGREIKKKEMKEQTVLTISLARILNAIIRSKLQGVQSQLVTTTTTKKKNNRYIANRKFNDNNYQ